MEGKALAICVIVCIAIGSIISALLMGGYVLTTSENNANLSAQNAELRLNNSRLEAANAWLNSSLGNCTSALNNCTNKTATLEAQVNAMTITNPIINILWEGLAAFIVIALFLILGDFGVELKIDRKTTRAEAFRMTIVSICIIVGIGVGVHVLWSLISPYL